jgi:nucleoside-diphosphate-sugar epimerase
MVGRLGEVEVMKRAILTGATGFIGSWLMEELLRDGVEVTALVCDSPMLIAEDIRDNIQVINYDPNRIFDLTREIESGFDVFYNIGWAGVAPEKKSDIDLQIGNIRSSLDALAFAKEIGCGKFIGIGTVAEYVYCDGAISHTQPPSPADLYGATKVAVHFMSEAYAKKLNLPLIWTILCSTYGERRNDDNLISYTIKSLLMGERPTFTKLEQMWDFLHVSDVVKALRLIGDRGVAGKTYGIGSGEWHPLRDYIETIHKTINPTLPLGIGERSYPEGRVSGSCVDNRELCVDTGFTPSVDFQSGIERTVSYFKERTV